MATVTYGKIQIEFRRATVADGLWREEIVSRLLLARSEPETLVSQLANNDPMVLYYRTFGRMISQMTSSNGLPFAVTRESTNEEINAAFECFFNTMDDEFFEACYEALGALRKPADPAMDPQGLGEEADPNSKAAASQNKTGGGSTGNA